MTFAEYDHNFNFITDDFLLDIVAHSIDNDHRGLHMWILYVMKMKIV